MTIEVFATIMALYPIARTEDIAREFGLSPRAITRMARRCRLRKSREYRSRVNRENGAEGMGYYRDHLTPFQKRVLRLRRRGMRNCEIAAQLGRSRSSVNSCIIKLKQKKRIEDLKIEH